jgi:hypothetical protein
MNNLYKCLDYHIQEKMENSVMIENLRIEKISLIIFPYICSSHFYIFLILGMFIIYYFVI